MSIARKAFFVSLPVLVASSLLTGTLFCIPSPATAVPQNDTTSTDLGIILQAHTAKERMNAVLQLSPTLNKGIRDLHDEQPWIPFDTSGSPFRGKQEMLPAAAEVLRRTTPQTTDNSAYDFDTIMVARLVAAIGGQRAVDVALPALLQAIAARSNSEYFATRWQMANCLVTLSGPDNTVRDIVKVLTTDPAPEVRAAAATTLGLSGKLLGNHFVEKLPDGSYRPLPAQAKLQNDFWNALTDLAKTAANDKAPAVRLAALDAMHHGIYGSRSVDWQSIYPYITKALDDKTRSALEHRAALRVLAEAPANPCSALSSLRPYLTASDEQSRGYAFTALGQITKSGNQEQVTQQYINDLKSSTQRLQTLHELEQSFYVVNDWSWTYHLPGGLDYYDSGLMDGGERVPGAKSLFLSTSNTSPPDQRVLAAVLKYGLDKADKESRLSSARLLSKFGDSYLSGYLHDSRSKQREEYRQQIVLALNTASIVIRVDDPAFSERLQQQSEKIKHAVLVIF